MSVNSAIEPKLQALLVTVADSKIRDFLISADPQAFKQILMAIAPELPPEFAKQFGTAMAMLNQRLPFNVPEALVPAGDGDPFPPHYEQGPRQCYSCGEEIADVDLVQLEADIGSYPGDFQTVDVHRHCADAKGWKYDG